MHRSSDRAGRSNAALGIATGEIDPTGDFGNLNQDPSWDKAFGYETDRGLARAAAAAAAKGHLRELLGWAAGECGAESNPTGKVSEGPSLVVTVPAAATGPGRPGWGQ